MSPDPVPFERPSSVELLFNRAVGFFVGLGVGFRHNQLLQVRGRTSGKLYSTPVDVLSVGDKRYLVAPRGNTQWVRNALAAGRITLKKGTRRTEFTLRTIPDAEKPELLKAYLDQFKLSVARFFPVPPGSAPAAFVPLAGRYPVFELIAIATG